MYPSHLVAPVTPQRLVIVRLTGRLPEEIRTKARMTWLA